jgi:hypothetical protein
MPRRSSTDPWVDLAIDLGQRVSSLLRDVVPPDAQQHLLNAQRELLTALFLIYEHQAGARRTPGERRVRQSARRTRKPRLTRIDVK